MPHRNQVTAAPFALRLADILARTRTVRVPPLPRSAEALLCWALTESAACDVVWIGDGPRALEIMHRDLRTLATPPDGRLLYYPAWESDATDTEIGGLRLQVLEQIGAGAPAPGGTRRIIATCIQALLQPTPSRRSLEAHTVTLVAGTAFERETFTERLEQAGYAFAPSVEEKGQAAVRGGIVDCWPPSALWPVRVEFFGSEVDSLRSFDPLTQRSVHKLERVTVPPARERLEEAAGPRQAADSLLEHLPDNAAFVWAGLDTVRRHALAYEETLDESGDAAGLLPFHHVRAQAKARTQAVHVETGDSDEDPAAGPFGDIAPVPAAPRGASDVFAPDLLQAARTQLVADLVRRAGDGQSVYVCFDTQGALDHFRERLPEAGVDVPAAANWHLEVGALSEGFFTDAMPFVLVAEPDLYGRRKLQGRRYDPQGSAARPATAGLRVSDLTEIAPGELVVHAEHGIGRYLGVQEITFNGRRQEVLSIEYAEDAKLHVPVSQAHLLSRYVGMSHSQATLHRLGGKRWNRERASAEGAIADLAASLLETHAQRSLLRGHVFPADTVWQHEFEAAFPYRETRDQHEVILAVKQDMESNRPMDRLICGDAGYGKTEVAMRAAFKTVMDGRQVAVLVPTTVLAQQHFQTFASRMQDYPVRVEMLSRFCPASRRGAVLQGMADGSVDIVIGTHALLQPAVRFANLGLVVIDEEQRFGVVHKERLKQMRRLVDVLTLTATPIPRTLYLSMTGARDMSLLQTPPLQRMAIETIVTRASDAVVRQAVLHELNRGGQVFYLHNRVLTIDRVRDHLAKLVPEARFLVAHGQMATRELAMTMRKFVNGECDVLVSTTIIESGMDIPTANTILIDRADRFGIADLYQLRGRVGRSSHKAYAYLMLPERGPIDHDASRRIGAVRKHSDLSAGFQLALRDLEIRGAGNLLGAAQSGHITAIGFGLYCQLLKRTVARLKGEPAPPIVDVELRLDFISLTPVAPPGSVPAVIPPAYIDDERLRISVYRRLAGASTPEEVAALEEELRDRFGPAPPPVRRLLLLAALRIACAHAGVNRVENREDRALFGVPEQYLRKDRRFPRLRADDPDGRLAELVELARTASQWADTPASGEKGNVNP